MAERKELPDIMGGLLGGKPKPARAEEPQPTPGAAPEPASKPVRQRAKPKAPPPPEAEEKIKATFYLSQEAVDALEDGWLQLRRLASDRSAVSKSAIVEAALEIALEELAKQGAESALARRMAGL